MEFWSICIFIIFRFFNRLDGFIILLSIPVVSSSNKRDWLVSGGGDPEGSFTTEVRTADDGVWTPGPNLHDGIYFGCQVALNQTHVFYADGLNLWASILDYETGTFQDQVTCSSLIRERFDLVIFWPSLYQVLTLNDVRALIVQFLSENLNNWLAR